MVFPKNPTWKTGLANSIWPKWPGHSVIFPAGDKRAVINAPQKKMGPQKWERPQKGPRNGIGPKKNPKMAKDPKMGLALKRTPKWEQPEKGP